MQIGPNQPRVEHGTTHGAHPTSSNQKISPELKQNVEKVNSLPLSFGAGHPPSFGPGNNPRVAKVAENFF